MNASELSASYNSIVGTSKKPSQWLRLKKTQALLNELFTERDMVYTDLVHSVYNDSYPDSEIVYLHPYLATHYSMWISKEVGTSVEAWYIAIKEDNERKSLGNRLLEQAQLIIALEQKQKEIEEQQKALAKQMAQIESQKSKALQEVKIAA